MIPVILSGGSGTRLWPLSRGQHPKQFLPLVTNNSMFQETVIRLNGLADMQTPIGVCNEDHRFMMAEQLRELNILPNAIILEPVGRNTAPAVALAAMAAESETDLLLVLPADHVIADVAALHDAINHAKTLANQGYLVTFGIVPTAPETGYGYIRSGDALSEYAYKVDAFVEKPKLDLAKQYLDQGGYFWNSGMFVFQAGRYLSELKKFRADIFDQCYQAFEKSFRDADFLRIDKQTFEKCPSDSIDFAVMEKTNQAAVVPLSAEWNDVGSWSALWEVTTKDEECNALNGDVTTINSKNCFVSANHRLVTTVGIEDMVVVETADAVLVAAKDQVQDVKDIVEKLKSDSRCEADIHRKVYRPWGYYDLLEKGQRHNAKRIVVNPGAKLSVQKHHHRAEHWVVVKGTALVTKADEQILLTENESTYIPLGVIHSLENPGVIPLEMIEIQSGSYLGEDDIVRFGDKYGRT